MIFDFLSPEDLAAIAAFLSALGSVIGGFIAVYIARKKADKDCKERIIELREEFFRGIELGEKSRKNDT